MAAVLTQRILIGFGAVLETLLRLTNLSWVGGFGEGSALEPQAESLLGMVHITVDLDSIFPIKKSWFDKFIFLNIL